MFLLNVSFVCQLFSFLLLLPSFFFFSQITCGDDCTGRLWDTYDRYLKNTVDLKKKARSVTISCQPLWAGGEEEEKEEEEEKKNESNNDNKNNKNNKNNKKEKIRHAAFGLFNGEVVVHRVDLTTDGLGKKGNPSVFLNLKDFCRCLTDFSQLYLLHWGFRNFEIKGVWHGSIAARNGFRT